MKYEYGVEYVTKGEKPDLPDDVLVRTQHNDGEWLDIGPVSHWDWPEIKKFRIVDERYKPKPNDWHERGELPPVGTGCEYIIGETRGYNECTFVGLNSRGSIVIEDCNGEYKTYHSHQIKFRPIRTERDVLVERAKSDFVKANVGGYTIYEERCIEALIDAGWRPVKQQTEDEFIDYAIEHLPGTIFKSERIELYRAGCRFVVVGDE